MESEKRDYTTYFLENLEGILNEGDLSRLQSIFSGRKYKKGDFFLMEGEKSIHMGLVKKGLFRSYYIDKTGNEITKYFYQEGSAMFSYVAYLTGKNSMYYIQALEDSDVLTAKISDFEKAIDGNYQLLLFYKKIVDKALVMKEEHACSFKLYNSTERYQLFQAEYPGLEKRIKQHQLASYLGITPVTLSRIRNHQNIIK